MHGTLNFLIVLMLPIILGASSLASPVRNTVGEPVAQGAQDVSSRSADTCPDTSLTRVVYQAYSSATTAHTLGSHFSWVNVDSKQGAGPAVLWSLQGPAFKIWPTQQPLTVPLFRLNPTTGADYVIAIGADAQTPPVISGFTITFLLGWVFNTPDCGGVPLMSLVLPSATDHYYTTDPDEHAGLLADSWTDGGIIAYVVPVASL